MYRTLNQLRWSMFAFVCRWDFLWTLTCLIALNIFMATGFAFQFRDNQAITDRQTGTAAYSILFGTFIWFPQFHWSLFDFITRVTRRNSIEWIAPRSVSVHIGASLGIMLLLSVIYSMIWTATSILFVASFPLFFSMLMLIRILSEVLILPSVHRWIQNGMPLIPMALTLSAIPLIFLDAPLREFDQLLKGQHVVAVWLLWLVSAILAILFVQIACIKREFIQITIWDNRGWKKRDDSRTVVNSEPAWWKNWVNRLFDRRMEKYLTNVESNGISYMTYHWRMGNRILWSAGFFYILWPMLCFTLPPLLFPSLRSVNFGLSTVMGYVSWGFACSLLIVPPVVAAEWRRRRKVMELEILRPVRPVDFQLQIATAFLRDIVPSIPIAGVGLFGLWTLADAGAERSQLTWFALMWIPTILVFMIAVTAALALFDDIGVQFLIGIFAFISGGFALFSYGLTLWAPGISFAISAIYFVISIGWIQQLYRVWEDMELGRRDSIQFD